MPPGLTDTAIRQAKPEPRPYNRYDTLGLYLTIAPTGAKWWRLKYRFAGKERRIGLGTYPEVSLKEARDGRDNARTSSEMVEIQVRNVAQLAVEPAPLPPIRFRLSRSYGSKNNVPGWRRRRSQESVASPAGDARTWTKADS
jgi:hypothetical protein